MLPLLKPGDELLINPRAYRKAPPCPGDIVIAQHPFKPDLEIIKRIAFSDADNRYHLRGDNPAESSDSRNFGLIPRRFITGKVTSRFA